MTSEGQNSSQSSVNSGKDKNISVEAEWIRELVRKEVENELERRYHEEVYKKELLFEAEHILEDQFGMDWLGH